MPFRPQVFLEHAKHIWPGDLPGAIRESCADYAAATTSRQKALCIKRLMEALDGAADADTRRSIMEACGRHCIAAPARSKQHVGCRGSLPTLMTCLSA